MTDMPYTLKDQNAFEWTIQAFDLLIEGTLSVDLVKQKRIRTATASGTCPRCEHDVAFTATYTAPLPAGAKSLGADSDSSGDDVEYESVDVQCRCKGTHPGRPKGVSNGCGIWFRADVKPENSDE